MSFMSDGCARISGARRTHRRAAEGRELVQLLIGEW